jgi:hypothetical protein
MAQSIYTALGPNIWKQLGQGKYVKGIPAFGLSKKTRFLPELFLCFAFMLNAELYLVFQFGTLFGYILPV